MTVYRNPFYARASEQQRDAQQFVMSFGPGAIDMLPEAIWDRLVVLRSTPGAGKTSLMRVFTVESIEWVRQRVLPTDPLYQQLVARGALTSDGPAKLGLLIDLDRDYRALLDLQLDESSSRRLFLRLLDVRVLGSAIRAALQSQNRPFPDDIDALTVDAQGDAGVEALLERVGGASGRAILEYGRQTERTILRLLDALLPSASEDVLDGHSELYSLRLLGEGRVLIDGKAIDLQPLLMFDDGHRLGAAQRDALIAELRDRPSPVARWYAERFEALSDQELLGDVGREGRDVVLVDLDQIARSGSQDGRRFDKGRYKRVLADIAQRRAAPALVRYAQEITDFFSLLDDDRDQLLGNDASVIVDSLKQRVLALMADDDRYRLWVEPVEKLGSFDAAARWKELEILVLRDRDRQQELFPDVLTDHDAEHRSSAAIREAAALRVALEFKLPYYAGEGTILRLSSKNAEQFLSLCGDLFAEMLVDISLGRRPHLNVMRQHRVIRQASERFWRSIPRMVPNGRDVQALVGEIVAIAQEENAKPKLPYPPGVTGTALLMSERRLLLDPEFRTKTPGADRLFSALASAVAHNILSATLDYSVKGSRYMVLYLNRLLCPRFELPLGLGSFREKRISTMIGWMTKLPAAASRSDSKTMPLDS